MTTHIYLETVKPVNDVAHVHVTLESYVVLFVYNHVRSENIQVHLVVFEPTMLSQLGIEVNLTNFNINILPYADFKSSSNLASLCRFPMLVNDMNVVVAGLCGVTRCIIKASPDSHALLGFKNGCLQAPAETSVWTKFCELDVISAINSILYLIDPKCSFYPIDLPSVFWRFEQHLNQPVRVHNIYKIARNQAKERLKQSFVVDGPQASCSDQVQEIGEKLSDTNIKEASAKIRQAGQITSSVAMADLDIAHTFAEGQHLTLADLLLFACFNLVRDFLPKHNVAKLDKELPLIPLWIRSVYNAIYSKGHIFHNLQRSESYLKLNVDKSDSRSLYKNDSKRYRPRGQIFTKQPDIDAALAKVTALNLDIRSDQSRFTDSDFAWWSTLPYDALPEGGELPPDRLLRKKHQLQCLAVEVLRIARAGDRIVDFCSGAGHLGIVIATLRPDCQVVLLENKEESLMRAKHRVERLGLVNVSFIQSNIDYFVGHLDVGTSLHACGIATDIVLNHCVQRRAAFVCCPCCYGGIREMAHIKYPRSFLFKDGALSTQDYLHVGHCADQAHDVRKGPCNEAKAAQGQRCMDVVDWDRKVCAEEHGYDVVLTRLQPEDCTTKNRLLVGTIKPNFKPESKTNFRPESDFFFERRPGHCLFNMPFGIHKYK